MDPGRVVPLARIVAGVWGDRTGISTANTVGVYISNLRRALRPDQLLVSRDGGYQLAISPDDLDVGRFRTLGAQGRDLLIRRRYPEAAERLREALALWRGPALGDLHDAPFAAPVVASLEEQRLAATEARIMADLALGILPGEVVSTAVELSRLHRTGLPYLLFVDGRGRGRVLPLDRSPVTIGHRAGNDVVLDRDRDVAAVHARLERTGEGWVIVDRSAGATDVGGEPVSPRRQLRDGDLVRVGRTLLLYRNPG